jgi:ankyrin repeat protein
VELLLSANAGVTGPDGSAELGLRTALHEAAEAGSSTVVEMLLTHGADPASRDKDGHTPMDLAVAASHEQVIKVLLPHNAEAQF